MLTLNDGRTELWQWDTGRKLSVDADCSQVHFSNKVFGRSVDVDVVDGVAIVPDILLQTDKELTAWAFVGTPENGYTKISKVFRVNRRNKPADYVFTPPERTTLEELVERLDKIEESQDPDAIKNAVEDYLQNNPIHVDEKDPTVPDWAKQPEKPKYTATEVGALPSTTNIPSKTSELINDSGFVNNVVANLVNYYLKSETYSRDEVKQLISAIPKFSIKPVSKLPTTDISETTIYLLPGGDGDDLYTEYIRVYGKWEILGSQKMDLTGYATETYVKDYAQPKGNYLTEVPKGYATEQFVKEQIAEAELGGEEVDLSGYALKSELPTKTSQLENDSGYLNAVPEGYAKTEDIPAKPEDIGAQPAGDYAIDYEIRLELEAINRRLTAFFDSDDQTLDELSEIVAYITSNKSLIDAITTSKVSVADIVNNLTTNVTNKPLSAAQGVALKALIDAIIVPNKLSDLEDDSTHRTVTDSEKTAWNAKSNFSGNYADLNGKPTIPAVPTNVSAFTNDAGYLTEVTGEKVKNALGYTPANVDDVFEYTLNPTFTNVLDEVGIEYGKTINASTGEVESTVGTLATTGFIQIKSGDVIRMSDFALSDTGTPKIGIYNSSKALTTTLNTAAISHGASYYFKDPVVDTNGHLIGFRVDKPSNGFMRISTSTAQIGANPVLTVNEEISYEMGYGEKLNPNLKVDFSQVINSPQKNGWSILPYERLNICYSSINRKPINTLEHFTDAATNFGYNVLKCDVRPTSDGELVCCHDAGFTFNSSGKITTYDSANSTPIRSVTAATVLGYSFPTGEHPCLVGDYLDICRTHGKVAFVTIRNEYMDVVIPKLLEELKAHNMTYATIINCMTYESLVQWREQDTSVMINYTLAYGVAINSAYIDKAIGLGYCSLCGFSLSGSATEPSASCDFEYARANGIRLLQAIAYKEGSPEACYAMGYDGCQIGIPWNPKSSGGGITEAEVDSKISAAIGGAIGGSY